MVQRPAHLEDEHFPAQDGERVEATVADVGLGVGVGGPVARGEPRRACLTVVFSGVCRGRARGRGRGQRLGRLRNLVRGP